MAARRNELLSPELTEARARELLRALPRVLRELLGSEILEAQYGWGANLHIDLCWKPMKVGTGWLERFVRESLEPAIIVPGKSDFTFIVRGGELEVEVCHDAHLHVRGTNLELISCLIAQAPFSDVGLETAEQWTTAGCVKEKVRGGDA